MKQSKLERNEETKSLRAQKCKDFVAIGVLFCLCLNVSECHQPGSVSLSQAEAAVEVGREEEHGAGGEGRPPGEKRWGRLP